MLGKVGLVHRMGGVKTSSGSGSELISPEMETINRPNFAAAAEAQIESYSQFTNGRDSCRFQYPMHRHRHPE